MKVNKFFLKVLAHLNYKYTYYSNLLHYPYRGYEAMQYLLENESFNTVLDVGCGEGIHSNIFYENGKEVTAIDYGGSSYFKKGESSDVKWKRVVGDVNKYEFDRQFDCIWCSHVLEHQLNPHDFLVRLHDLCRVGGVIAITVPPMKTSIVSGHVSLWNAGMLLYRLVLAGFDCSDAHVKTYDYDVSVIVRKRSINVLDELVYDMGDLKNVIQKYLPKALDIDVWENGLDISFDGNIEELNWKRRE